MKKIHFKVIDSTNKYLKENYQKYDNLTFASASYQTNGKGREDRKWISNKGENLLFSLLIKDPNLINRYASLSLLSGYVIYKVLKNLNINDVTIKWPNDVYVSGKKICGILMESVSIDNEIKALIIGVGLNVNQINIECDQKVTSIRETKQKKVFIPILRNKVYRCLKSELDLLLNDKSNYLSGIRLVNYLKDKEVTALINGKEEKVKVIDINDDNSLLVINNGKKMNLYFGEVHLVSKNNLNN